MSVFVVQELKNGAGASVLAVTGTLEEAMKVSDVWRRLDNGSWTSGTHIIEQWHV